MSIIESAQSLILEDRTDYGCAGLGMFNMCPSYKLYVKAVYDGLYTFDHEFDISGHN